MRSCECSTELSPSSRPRHHKIIQEMVFPSPLPKSPPPHRHAYVVLAPTGRVVVVTNDPGGPYPTKAVLMTRGQPPQLTVTVLVVYVKYEVDVLPADRSGWTTRVVGHAGDWVPPCGSLAFNPARGVGKDPTSGRGAVAGVACPARRARPDGRHMVLQKVLGVPAVFVALITWLGHKYISLCT
jgi:hypothetical protein